MFSRVAHLVLTGSLMLSAALAEKKEHHDAFINEANDSGIGRRVRHELVMLPYYGGRRAAALQSISQPPAGGARSPHQHPRNRSVLDRDGPRRHHRERRRRHTGREPQ